MQKGSRFRIRGSTALKRLVGYEWTYDKTAKPPKLTKTPKYTAASSTSDWEYVEKSWDNTNPGPPYRSGGPLYLVKVTTPWGLIESDVELRASQSSVFEVGYTGGFYPTAFGPNFITNSNQIGIGESGSLANIGDAAPYGAEAYAKAAPQVENADGLVALIESADVTRTLEGSANALKNAYGLLGGSGFTKYMSPLKVADAFLTHQFGWVPFLSDLSKFAKTYRKSHDIMSQISRDNNKGLKRVRSISTSRTNTFVSREYQPLCGPPLNGLLVKARTVDGRAGCIGYTDFYQRTSSDIWFEAVYKYYLAEFAGVHKNRFNGRVEPANSWDRTIVKYLDIYGIRVSPYALYRAIPWSWLLDWFSRGSVLLKNLSMLLTDNLVSQYAYIMRHEKIMNVADVHLFTNAGDINLVWAQEVESKHRARANPFGNFSTTDVLLSARQYALLAALGITHAPR